jgi:ubiquinone/menaquinone biosynthesis C-methylase UbiE
MKTNAARLRKISSEYALDNSAIQAGDRFTALAELFDPGTFHHLERCGVGRGWHCLEIGGGGGSIARWLSERVGPAGQVVVTDINTRFLDQLSRPNLEVRRHNIVSDPLPEAAFDLVHARLVLMHLRERDAVLARILKALKPGGWLVDEEFDVLSVRPEPDLNPAEALPNSLFALMRVMTDRGVHNRFGRLLFGKLRALGLEETGAQARLSVGTAGSAVATLVRTAFEQLREEMIAGGYISADEVDHDLRRVAGPDIEMLTPTLWSAWGRKPR